MGGTVQAGALDLPSIVPNASYIYVLNVKDISNVCGDVDEEKSSSHNSKATNIFIIFIPGGKIVKQIPVNRF